MNTYHVPVPPPSRDSGFPLGARLHAECWDLSWAGALVMVRLRGYVHTYIHTYIHTHMHTYILDDSMCVGRWLSAGGMILTCIQKLPWALAGP